MSKAILMDEFHVGVFVPRGLRKAEYGAICRTLDGARFRARLRRAVRDACRRYPSLHKVKITVTC